MKPLPNVFRYLSVYREHVGRRLYLVFGLTLLAATTEGFGIALLLPLIVQMDVTQPVATPSAFGNVLTSAPDWLGIPNSTVGILLLISAIFLLKGGIKFAEGAYKGYLKARLMRDLRTRLFDNYSTMDYRFYTRHNTGHFVNLINPQVHSAVLSFEQYNRFLAAVITLTAYFGFAFLLSWRFAGTALLAGLGILLVFRKLNRFVRRLSQMTAEEAGTLNHFLVQTMQAFKYLAATARIAPLRSGVTRSIGSLADHQRKQDVAAAFTESLREPVSVGILVVIILMQIVLFNEPLAPILVTLLLIHRAIGQVMLVQGAWQKTMNQIGGLELVERELRGVAACQQRDGTLTAQAFDSEIVLRNVHFRFDGAESDALRGVSMSIPAKQTIALVGESGAGKSTLVDLLTLMLRPTSGELLVDGVSHEQISTESWRNQIGYVSQEMVVFDDTIANNIALWHGDMQTDPAVRARIERAAERAHAGQLIADLPDGYDTVVGDRGIRLSGGQRQRLFIARELFKNPNLLILDEATSALDSESEKIIKQSVDQLKGSTTVVIIAHRLSTIRDVDYVYVLDQGCVVEQGTYDELTGLSNSRFNRMVALQKL